MNGRSERKQRRWERARRDVLDAAERALTARGGLTGLTLEDIAREAGYTPGALYTYFANKEALVVELFGRLHEEMVQAVEEPAPDGLGFVALLEWRIGRVNAIATRHRALFYAHFVQGHVPGAHPEGLPRAYTTFISALVDIMRRGIAEGVVRDADPGDLAFALFGLLQSFFIRWLFTGGEEPIESLLPRALSLFLNGARRDPERKTS